MKDIKRLANIIFTAFLTILIIGTANAQKERPVTSFAPEDRPPIQKGVEKSAPDTPGMLPNGIHLPDGSRQLILQNLNIGILIADEAGSEQEVADYLLASGHVSTADFIDARYSTPTLPDIQGYDVIITWKNYYYADPVALGDLLADYVDLGMGVVALEFVFFDNAPLEGRFMAEHCPFSLGNNTYVDVSLGTYDTDHPLMADVSAVTDFYVCDVGLTDHGTCVAWWDNDWPFVAYNHDNNRVVGINGYVGGVYPLWTGDMLQVVLNSVLYVTTTQQDIPTLSEWGMLLMGLLLLAAGTIAVVRRRKLTFSRTA